MKLIYNIKTVFILIFFFLVIFLYMDALYLKIIVLFFHISISIYA